VQSIPAAYKSLAQDILSQEKTSAKSIVHEYQHILIEVHLADHHCKNMYFLAKCKEMCCKSDQWVLERQADVLFLQMQKAVLK